MPGRSADPVQRVGHITEALELTFERVDSKRHSLTFESVRKRKAEVFRTVPVPPELIHVLGQVHNVGERRGRGRYRFLWRWHRSHAWRLVRGVMQLAGIQGPQATPKGLRHGFGVVAAEANIPITLIQQWMGHASLEFTTSYYNVLTHDERACAARLWNAPTAIIL